VLDRLRSICGDGGSYWIAGLAAHNVRCEQLGLNSLGWQVDVVEPDTRHQIPLQVSEVIAVNDEVALRRMRAESCIGDHVVHLRFFVPKPLESIACVILIVGRDFNILQDALISPIVWM
jgi:hypothetical protein